MVSALPKAKVVYHDVNLSALAIFNFAQAVKSDVQVVKAPKPNVNRNEFQHVELKIGSMTINGELAILDFLATQKNSSSGSKYFLQGRATTLVFDDWVSILNRKLRAAVNTQFVNKDGSDAKEVIKGVAKALEDQKVLELLV